MKGIFQKLPFLGVVYAADPKIVSCWEEFSVNEVATLQAFECIFESLINIAISVGGVIAFIMLIMGGFSYLTAGDDPKKAQKARNTITFAVIGLVLLIAAWFILSFIEELTGINVTIFKIGD
jgi:hypothetical protein